MAWSSPRVWAVGELLTAGNMNTYISDNLSYLKSAVSAQIELFGSALLPSYTQSAYGAVRSETTTNKAFIAGMGFLPGTLTYAEVDIPSLPSDYNGGSVTAKFTWYVPTSSTNSVVWGLQGMAYADGNALDTAFGSAQEVTDANTGSSCVNISGVSSAITFGGTAAAGQALHLRVYRKGSGSDNHAGTAVLLGVTINYTRT